MEKLAHELRQHKIRLWYDGWQVKPGDVLRNRILDGIENANFLLVIISRASLNSSWVQYELNAAMIEEIESRHVKVIPSIIGDVKHEQLPADLRAKYYLDLHSSEQLQESIHAMVNLVRPERKQRQELLARLRNPERKGSKIVSELRKAALGGFGQDVEIAAMSGLAKVGGADAVLAITERVLDVWGLTAVKRGIKILPKLKADGGLLALSATLFSDSRIYILKLLTLSTAIRKIGGENANALTKQLELYCKKMPRVGMEYIIKDSSPIILEDLEKLPFDDIRYGVILARAISKLPSWAGPIAPPIKPVLDEVRIYTDHRVPGLFNLIFNLTPW